jgi:CheY-like chemotaxis protein
MARKLVLVVDDEHQIRELFGSVLRQLGHVWETACDAAEALRKVENTEFDLVFTDFNMPGMNGFELAQEIKRRKQRMPVVLITGSSPEFVPPHIDRVLRKPFTVDELRETISAFA